MNNKGSISVEALISVTVFILLMAFLSQMLMVFSVEDSVSQQVFDDVYHLENYGYLYEKIGLLNEPISVEAFDNQDLLAFINTAMQTIDHHTKESYLQFMFRTELDDYLSVENFQLLDDQLVCQLSYERKYLFGLTHKFVIDIEKQLWLFGDDKSLYPHKTLTDLLKNQRDEEKNHLVYTTKTGEKYHLKGCFYLIRSTTDKDNINTLSLFDAKYKYLYKPCKKCYKEEPWN